eukprot:9481516-Pyramimonas_sp.AAC.1
MRQCDFRSNDRAIAAIDPRHVLTEPIRTGTVAARGKITVATTFVVHVLTVDIAKLKTDDEKKAETAKLRAKLASKGIAEADLCGSIQAALVKYEGAA